MLVSHSHKFIYTKTVKTGGTSVESYFERFCMPGDEWTESHWRYEHVSESGIVGHRGPNMPGNCGWWNHMSARLIRQRVGEEIWNGYLKFCVIRNPYDKVISAFYFFRRRSNPHMEFSDPELDRELFGQWVQSGYKLPIDNDKFLIDGTFCLDDVIRHESLHQDLERICGRLGVQWNLSWLPVFKTGVRPKYASAEALYTDKSRKVVETAFAFELDYFKYVFPAGDSSN